MQTESIHVTPKINKLVALYQLERDFKNRSESIEDAINKAIKYEQLTQKQNELQKHN